MEIVNATKLPTRFETVNIHEVTQKGTKQVRQVRLFVVKVYVYHTQIRFCTMSPRLFEETWHQAAQIRW